MIEILSNSLVPVFVVLLFGYAAGHWKVVDNQNVQGLVSFLMSFALPCSLFVTIAHTTEALLWSQIKTAVVLAIVYLAVFIGTYYALRKLAQDTPANSAVLALTLGFPNVAGIGIPLLLAVYGPQASVTVAVAVAVGAITVTPDHSGDSGSRNQRGPSLVSSGSRSPIGLARRGEAGVLGTRARGSRGEPGPPPAPLRRFEPDHPRRCH
ncbi:MAG: AEC family transporter [Pseudomonadota bacterium]